VAGERRGDCSWSPSVGSKRPSKKLWNSYLVTSDGSTNEGGQRTPSINSLKSVTFSRCLSDSTNDFERNWPYSIGWCLAFAVPLVR